MTGALCYDIETIPQLTSLSEIQSEELNRKLANYMARRPDDEEEETRRLLMGTSPYFGEIICIGLGYESNSDFKTKAIIGGEASLLTEFWSVLSKFDGTFISFNGLEFDVPFITARSMKHGINVSNKSFLNTRRFQKHPHFDVKQVMSDWDRYRSCTLQLACDHLGVSSPKDGEIKAKDVAAAFADGRIEEIADYCLKDIKATYEIYKIVKQYTLMR